LPSCAACRCTLCLANAPVRDFAPLADLQLDVLGLEGTKVRDLGSVGRIKTLQYLGLDKCGNMSDLTLLLGCKYLVTVKVPEGLPRVETLRKAPFLHRINGQPADLFRLQYEQRLKRAAHAR